MKYKISAPENLFEKTQADIRKLERQVRIYRRDLADEKEKIKKLTVPPDGNLVRIKFNLAIKYQQLQQKREKMDSYFDYLILRSHNFNFSMYDAPTHTKIYAEHLGVSEKEICKKRRRIIKHGFAYLIDGEKGTGKRVVFKSKDEVWGMFGVLVAQRQYDPKTGKRMTHQKLGVYKISGEKKIIKRKGVLKPDGTRYKKDQTFVFQKKIDVKVLKFEVEKFQLNKTELKLMMGLELIKHYSDKINSKQCTQELRETATPEVTLSCETLARKVGYTTAPSGMIMRKELESRGFLTIIQNSQIVQKDIQYQEAKENYELHQGIQLETGLAYYYKENCVIGVKCYCLIANGHQPITYPKKKKKVLERKKYVHPYLNRLKTLEGLTIKKIYKTESELFDVDSPYCCVLLEMLFENPEGLFSYSEFETNLIEHTSDIKKEISSTTDDIFSNVGS